MEAVKNINGCPACHPQTHNFHIARHGKCQDCGGAEWMDAPAQAQGVEEAAFNWAIDRCPSCNSTRYNTEACSCHRLEEAFLAGSRWQQGQDYTLSRQSDTEADVTLHTTYDATPPQPPTIGARWDEKQILNAVREELISSNKECGIADGLEDNDYMFIGVVSEAIKRRLSHNESPCTCQQELEELRRWKAEAIAVMPDYQAIGKELNIPLGQSIHDKILPGIQALKSKPFPTREEVEKWAYDEYSSNTACVIALAMYDWIAEKIKNG